MLDGRVASDVGNRSLDAMFLLYKLIVLSVHHVVTVSWVAIDA